MRGRGAAQYGIGPRRGGHLRLTPPGLTTHHALLVCALVGLHPAAGTAVDRTTWPERRGVDHEDPLAVARAVARAAKPRDRVLGNTASWAASRIGQRHALGSVTPWAASRPSDPG